MAAAVLSHRCEDEQQNVGKLFLTTSFEGRAACLECLLLCGALDMQHILMQTTPDALATQLCQWLERDFTPPLLLPSFFHCTEVLHAFANISPEVCRAIIPSCPLFQRIYMYVFARHREAHFTPLVQTYRNLLTWAYAVFLADTTTIHAQLPGYDIEKKFEDETPQESKEQGQEEEAEQQQPKAEATNERKESKESKESKEKQDDDVNDDTGRRNKRNTADISRSPSTSRSRSRSASPSRSRSYSDKWKLPCWGYLLEGCRVRSCRRIHLERTPERIEAAKAHCRFWWSRVCRSGDKCELLHARKLPECFVT